MARKNIFSKFAPRTTFLNVGLALFSALLGISFLVNGKTAPENALLHPAVAYGISFLVAAIGASSRQANAYRFNIFRDALPLPTFASCLLLGGNLQNWVWVLFALAVTCSIGLLILAKKHEWYDEDDDRVEIHWR